MVTDHRLPLTFCLLSTAYYFFSRSPITIYYFLPIVNCLLFSLPITVYYFLPIVNCLLSTAYCQLSTAYCLLFFFPITDYRLLLLAYCQLPTAYYFFFRLPLTTYRLFAHCPLPTAYLPIAYCLLPLLPTALYSIAASTNFTNNGCGLSTVLFNSG